MIITASCSMVTKLPDLPSPVSCFFSGPRQAFLINQESSENGISQEAGSSNEKPGNGVARGAPPSGLLSILVDSVFLTVPDPLIFLHMISIIVKQINNAASLQQEILLLVYCLDFT